MSALEKLEAENAELRAQLRKLLGRAPNKSVMPPRAANTISQQLFEIADRRGLKGRDMAARAGVSYVAISNWRRGVHDMTLTSAQRVAASLGYELKLSEYAE